jgi:hypothetical protein
MKGSGYRSIQLDKLEAILKEDQKFNLNAMPRDCVLFIDPCSVSYRHGSKYVVSLYEGKRNVEIKRPPLPPLAPNIDEAHQRIFGHHR